MAGMGIVDISESTLLHCIHDLYVVLLYFCTAVLSLPTFLEDCSIHHYHYSYLGKFYIFIAAQRDK
jgi:hypothetical protein